MAELFNPFEKYAQVKLDHETPNRDEKKKYFKPPPWHIVHPWEFSTKSLKTHPIEKDNRLHFGGNPPWKSSKRNVPWIEVPVVAWQFEHTVNGDRYTLPETNSY